MASLDPLATHMVGDSCFSSWSR